MVWDGTLQVKFAYDYLRLHGLWMFVFVDGCRFVTFLRLEEGFTVSQKIQIQLGHTPLIVSRQTYGW